MMDVIDCLPTGLHEMIISPRPVSVPHGGFVTGDWIARFEARSLDDIRALGRNSPEDDRAFAAVARVSELNLTTYRTVMQPLVRALVSQPMADLARAMNPLRLSYTIFADSNPWMKGVQALAAGVAAARRPAAADNAFLALQKQVSDQIIAALNGYQAARDKMAEKMFFGFYGSPVVQKFLGIDSRTEVRPPPTISPDILAAHRARADSYATKLRTGGFDAALTRAVLYVLAADWVLDQRCALALNAARRRIMRLPLADFKVLVREQSFLLQTERDRAVEALAVLVPEPQARRDLLEQVRTIVAAGDPPTAGERDRLTQLSQVLAVPVAQPVAAPKAGRTAAAGATTRPEAVLQ
jgi:hypothetical protein